MPRSFSSFLSNRYCSDLERVQRHQTVLGEIPNFPRVPRLTARSRARSLKTSELLINNRFTYLYGRTHPSSDWRHGDDIPIVVRREMEKRLNEQLIPFQPVSETNVFSHTIWHVQTPEESPALRAQSGSKVGIITALAKPKKRCGRKPKNNNVAQPILCQNKVVATEPPKVEEPPTKPMQRRRLKQKGEQFKCETCSRTFNHSWMLIAHTRVHTGERPFVCPEKQCQKSFADRSNLRTHQRAMGHHDWEHQCGQCGKYFNTIFYLNNHTLRSCRKYLMTAMHKKS